MKNITGWLKGLLGLAALAVLIVGLIAILGPASKPAQRGQEVAPPQTLQEQSKAQTQTPTPVMDEPPAAESADLFQSPIKTPPPPTPTEIPWSETPTPTMPPVPTPLPTPVVTPIPVAEPPFIPLPPKESTEPYTILLREGNIIRAIKSDGTGERVLLDTYAQLSLFLGSRSAGVRPWARGGPSPDGSQLALVLSTVETLDELGQGDKAPEYSIHLFDIDTGQSRLLVRNGIEPVWSPDGGKIAYRSTQTHGLWVVDVATGEAKEVFPVDRSELDYWVNFFTWSPDSKRIALVKTYSMLESGEIWLVNADGQGKPALLVPLQPPKTGQGAVRLNWSPTGDLILFTSRFGEYATPSALKNLWTVDVKTGIQRQLTQNMYISGGTPSWYLDGNWIVFVGLDALEAEQPSYDLWLIAKDGNELKRITQDLDSDLHPQWIASRNKISFQKDEAGIWEVDLDDGTFKQIHPQKVDYMILE